MNGVWRSLSHVAHSSSHALKQLRPFLDLIAPSYVDGSWTGAGALDCLISQANGPVDCQIGLAQISRWHGASFIQRLDRRRIDGFQNLGPVAFGGGMRTIHKASEGFRRLKCPKVERSGVCRDVGASRSGGLPTGQPAPICGSKVGFATNRKVSTALSQRFISSVWRSEGIRTHGKG